MVRSILWLFTFTGCKQISKATTNKQTEAHATNTNKNEKQQHQPTSCNDATFEFLRHNLISLSLYLALQILLI